MSNTTIQLVTIKTHIKIVVEKSENTFIQVTLINGVLAYKITNPIVEAGKSSIHVECLPKMAVEYYTEDRGEGKWIVMITQIVASMSESNSVIKEEYRCIETWFEWVARSLQQLFALFY
jgi:hypothetical protein